MKELRDTSHVSAGFAAPIVEAVIVGVGVYTTAGDLAKATQELNALGAGLGKSLYEHNNPNPLGQTVYTANDFRR